MKTKTKRIAAAILAWLLGVLAGAGIFALFQNPADKGYWSSVAGLAVFLLAILVATWVRNERPKRSRGLWAMALALTIPALILAFSFGPGPAVGALGGGLTAALIITWPYLGRKETAHKLGG